MEFEAAVPAEAHRAGANRERDREQEGREHELREPEERCDAYGDEDYASDERRNDGPRAHAQDEERERSADREREHQNPEPLAGNERDESDGEEKEGDEGHEAESGRNAEPHRSALVRREDLGDLLTRQLELFANVGAHVLADSAEERAVTGPFVHGRDCAAHDMHARGGAGYFDVSLGLERGVV